MGDAHGFAELLSAHSGELGALGVDASAQAALSAFLAELWHHNQSKNLVSRKLSRQVLITAHLMDSLLALPYLPHGGVVADLGSGGGFPGIPLAICRPRVHFRLYEKSPVKLSFLEQASRHLDNLSVCGKLDPHSLDGDVDLAIARAFRPLPAALAASRQYFARGGRYLFYKGRREKIDEEIKAAKIPPHGYRITVLEPPQGIEERHLLWINPRQEDGLQ